MVTISKYCILLVSGATVHGFPVIRTDQPSRFGTQVIRGSADNFFFISSLVIFIVVVDPKMIRPVTQKP